MIGDGEIGVGALPARTAGGSAGGEVGGHLGRVAVEVVPDRALDVREVRSGVIDGGGWRRADREVAGAIDGAGRGGDGEFAGGGSRWDDRDELGGGAGVERGGDDAVGDGEEQGLPPPLTRHLPTRSLPSPKYASLCSSDLGKGICIAVLTGG